VLYYTELFKFPHSVLTEEYQRPSSDPRVGCLWPVSLDFIKKEIIDLLTHNNLNLEKVIIFKKPPTTREMGMIHADYYWDKDKNNWLECNCAVNINLDRTDSVMYWYSSLNPVTNPDEIGTDYPTRKTKNFTNCTLVETLSIMNPTIVRIGVPHTVKNLATTTRWCVSLRFAGNPTFEECVDKLKNFI
jgi:hypothetical protein